MGVYSEIIRNDYIPFGSGLPREPGTHLTSIIRYIQSKLGMIKKADGWDMDVCSDIGFLWETALSYAYRDRRVLGWDDPAFVVSGSCGDIIRPDSIELDGVHMSPDGMGSDPLGEVAYADHEYKCTWRSSKNDPLSDFYWDNQFKCYCKGLETNVTVLHVMYLMGNYNGSGPQHVVFRFKWDQEDIDESWAMILRNKKGVE